jgi:hypothetical protein
MRESTAKLELAAPHVSAERRNDTVLRRNRRTLTSDHDRRQSVQVPKSQPLIKPAQARDRSGYSG